MSDAQLGPRERAQAIEALEQRFFDILVVGGGVTGCGVALDAQTRGLSCALVEQGDLAEGTSSRSGKLIHGGLRYLEQLDIALVRESLRERALIMALAPHLVRPVRFLYPLEHRLWERAYLGAGLSLYDHMGARAALEGHRHLSHRRALAVAPGLRGDRIVGGVAFSDAQVDDARHTVTLARSAMAHGALVATRARLVGFAYREGRIVGARVRDGERGRELLVRARHIVGAVGVWTGELQRLAGAKAFDVRASKGVHLLVPRDTIRTSSALLVRAQDSVIFVRPWQGHWLVGTTDTDWPGAPGDPQPSSDDIDYLLRNLNRLLARPLRRSDVVAAYAGLRPLLSGAARRPSELRRRHGVASPLPGLTLVAGGKYTTYRVMAADAVDAAAAALPGAVPPSRSAEVALLGAEGFSATWQERRHLAGEAGITPWRMERLLRRYGSEALRLLALMADAPALRAPIEGAEGYLAAEAWFAVSHEGALHLDDVLARRLRAAIETSDRAVGAAKSVADIVAPVLGWDPGTAESEVRRYRRQVERAREAEAQPEREPGAQMWCETQRMP